MMETSESAADDLSPPEGDRHVLEAETELRLEVSHGSLALLILQKGSCELWGVELALNKTYTLTGGAKLALFTWHGCVIDVACENLEISYISDETNANVAYVNTHAQLETLRDEALSSQTEGPRVLIAGPAESGKSSLAHILIAYGTFLYSYLFVSCIPYTNSRLLVSYKVGTNAFVGRFGSSRQCSFGSRNLGSGTNDGIEYDGRAWSSTRHTPRHVVWEYVARQYRALSSTSICNDHKNGPTHAGGFGFGKG
jgi:hypothetical protein